MEFGFVTRLELFDLWPVLMWVNRLGGRHRLLHEPSSFTHKYTHLLRSVIQ